MRLMHFGGTNWSYSEWRPGPPDGLVELMWCMKGATVNRLKRVLPNGRVELLLNFGEPYRVRQGPAGDLITGSSLSGLQTGPLVIEQPPHQDIMGIRLRPVGAFAILDLPMTAISGLSVTLFDLVKEASEELEEGCLQAVSVEQRFALAADWICRRALRRRVDPAVEWAVRQVETHPGDVVIRALQQQIGWSKTRLAATFREQIGVTPKFYARLLRFSRARRALQKTRLSLVEVAVESGYYDQPHMNAEFRGLGGRTPTEFIRLGHPVGDGSTMTETA